MFSSSGLCKCIRAGKKILVAFFEIYDLVAKSDLKELIDYLGEKKIILNFKLGYILSKNAFQHLSVS